MKLLNQWFLVFMLKSSFRKFYGRHGNLANRKFYDRYRDFVIHYGISVSQMTTICPVCRSHNNRSSTTEANSRAGTITYLHISTSVLWCPLRFPSKTMFGLSLFLFNLLFMLLYLFTYTYVHHVRWYSCHLMGVTSGAWTAYLPGAREFTPGFVLFNLCGVDHCTHVFRPFCFGHCMICSRSSWYLLLYSRVTSKVMIQLIVIGPSPILSYI